MGLISKIEDKLSGGSDKNEEQKLEKSEYGSTHGRGSNEAQNPLASSHGSGSGRSTELQHPISSSTGNGRSGIVGGTALEGGYGSEAFNRPHGTTGSSEYARDRGVSSTSDQLRNTHIRDPATVGVASSTDRNTPRQPFDPYSSKGQQIAANAGTGTTSGYGASQGRAEAGDIGSRRHADDPSISRTAGGGVSNQIADKPLYTGSHSQLENRDAVPTAGGHKVGSGATSSIPGSYDSYDNTGSKSQHHYGRDAALAGGAGAAGVGAYEGGQRYGDAGRSHELGRVPESNRSYESGRAGDATGPAPNTAGPHKSDMLNKMDPRVEANPEKKQEHRDAAIVGGAGGAGGAGIYGAEKVSDRHHTTHSSTTRPDTTRGSYDTGTTTGSSGKYGENVSYMNRPSADTPLTHNQDFSERHPHSTTAGAGAAGLGAGALGANALSGSHGRQQDRNVSGSTTSSQPGVVGGIGHSTTSPTSPTSATDDHASRGSEQARRMGGAYEAGYKDGYRDAMAHRASQV